MILHFSDRHQLNNLRFLTSDHPNFSVQQTSSTKPGLPERQSAELEWFLFNLLAVGPIGTSVLLWANFFVHGTPIVTTHDVGIVDTNGTLITYNFKDNYLEGFPFARSTYKDLVGPVGRTIEITEAQGLFGYPVVLKKEVIL